MKNCSSAAGMVCLGLALTAAHAQTVINNGSNNTTNVIVQRAPAVIIERAPPTRPLPAPMVRPPPSTFPYQQRDLLPYMSPRCAQLFEAQLAGHTRRTSYSTGGEVREEFRLGCQDALSVAQKALYEDRLRSYNLRQESARADRFAAEQSKLAREQCDELLRILAAKRKRVPTMNEGERTDHERAESNYRARCGGT